MKQYNLDNPIDNIIETENPYNPYEYPKSRVRYLDRGEFLEWSNGKEWR